MKCFYGQKVKFSDFHLNINFAFIFSSAALPLVPAVMRRH